MLDRGARWSADGSVLVGGSPMRLLSMTAAGRDLVDRLARGADVPASPAVQSLARRLLTSGLAHPRPPVRGPAAPGEVVVVIPVRNDPAGLAATLAALSVDRPGSRDSGVAGDPPIVVVDDASRDPDAVRILCHQRGVSLHRRDACGGPAAARNEGWRAVRAPFIAFVDAGCEPEPGWLDRLLPHFADPQVAAVAPRITSTSDDRAGRRTMAAYEVVASPLDVGEQESIVRPRSRVAYVPTAALVVRRRALEALGGFDPSLTVGEDVDLVWRLVAAGCTVRYEPVSVVRHPVRPSWPAWAAQRYRYGTSAAALARRHGWAVAPATVPPWTAVAWVMLALGQPLLGVAGAVAATWRCAMPLRDLLSASEAFRLAGRGHLRGGLALARGLRRAWAPAAVALAMSHRRSLPALAAAVAVLGALEWLQRRPRLDPVRFVGFGLCDDLAYGAGLWTGCARERSARALLPDLRRARTGPGAPS